MERRFEEEQVPVEGQSIQGVSFTNWAESGVVVLDWT